MPTTEYSLGLPEYNQIVRAITRADALLTGHRNVLKLLAKRASLLEILHRLVSVLEEQYEGSLCSILLVDELTSTFRAGVEVSDAKNYKLEASGVSILPPYTGPCCMAAHVGEFVLTSDIATDPRWQSPWRQWALDNGLKSCRSHPIFSSTGKVLGTFAMYHKNSSDPTADSLYQIELATYVAGIAIERKLIEALEIEKWESQERLNRDLSHALSLRDEFLSVASHELRAPLTALKLQIQLKQHKLKSGQDFSKDEIINVLESNEAQVNRAINLVETLLDLSRFSSGRLEMRREEVDLCALTRDVLGRMQPQLAQAACVLELSCSDSLIGYWDQFRLEQVLVNLITNAIKYGAEKPISISLMKIGSKARIVVKDNGIGIDSQDHRRIFNRFERVVPRESSIPGLGLGLGLHIVRELVEAHSGDVWVESSLGKGATFFVELPFNFDEIVYH